MSKLLNVTKLKQIVERTRMKRRVKADLESYTASATNTIYITVPLKSRILDPIAECGILFDMVGSATGTTNTLTFNNFAASTWIKDVRFYAGNNQIGKTLKRYNGYCNFRFKLYSNNEWQSSFGGSLEGAKAFAENNAATSRQYFHTFQAGFLTAEDYIALDSQDYLRIEIDLEIAKNVVVHDGTANTEDYVISSIYFVSNFVDLNEQGRSMVKQELAAGVRYHYEEYHSYIDTSITGDSVVNAGDLDGGLKSIFAFFVLDSQRDRDYDDTDLDYWGAFSRNNLSQYRFKIGELDLTPDAVRVSATRLAENTIQVKDAMMASQNMVGYAIGSELLSITSTDFIFAQRAQLSNEMNKISSVIDESKNKLTVDMEFSSSPASATLYVYSILDKEVLVKNGESIKNTTTHQLIAERKQDLSDRSI